MTSDRRIWDTAYGQRGQLWAGMPPALAARLPAGRVLELGCGNGKMLPFLSREGSESIGLDFSRAALMAAKARSCLQPDPHLVLADATLLPFKSGMLDAVLARHVIGHADPPGREQISCEIHRVLRPGGIFHFSGFSQRDFRYGQGTLCGEGSFVRGNGIRTHYFTREEVLLLFSRFTCTGIEVTEWNLRIRGRDHTRSEIHALFSR
ncbi:MAG: class I SAM-dependent methyltransferase [Methanomicrobiales archaeon]|nr:class I SAM-dependent methyltransferase [Methanomicrobiales archaeon]